tara:strand:+ start:238 stop:720 length:483 start_codon:yes stop_codon:yes gene_type:complete
MVEIFDNFFPREIKLEIYELLQRPKWEFTAGGSPHNFWQMKLTDEEYFNTYLFNEIQLRLDRKFSRIERIYVNGQTAMQSGVPHTDDAETTFLYYSELSWSKKYQGNLVFFDEDTKEENRVVEYKSNRAILFPAHLTHYASPPNRLFSGLRTSLAYKLWN